MTPSPRRRWAAELSLVGITFIWGATFVVVKKALQDSSTLLFLALRFSVAAGVLAILFRKNLGREAWRSALNPGSRVGCFLFLGYFFQTVGLRHTTPAKSGLITGLAVVLVPVLDALVFRVIPGWNLWLGVPSAAAGLYLLTAPAGFGAISGGDFWTLLGAIAFSVHILLLGRYSASIGANRLAMVQISVAAVLALGLFGWAEHPFIHWSGPLIAAILVTGLLATALAFWVQTWAQQYTTPARTGLILTMESVFAWLTSYVVLGERLGSRGSLGAGLILLGIILSELKPR